METSRAGAFSQAEARRPGRLRSSPRTADLSRARGAGGGHRAGWSQQVGIKEDILEMSWVYPGIETE